MRIGEAAKRVRVALQENIPILLVGGPGVGKSDVEAQARESLSWPGQKTYGVVSDPVDFKGLPALREEGAVFLPLTQTRRAVAAEGPFVWFFDDVGQAPKAVQAALMQVILARSVDEHIISPTVRMVAATNRREDRAGVEGVLEPLKSRFWIVPVEAHLDDWSAWALQNDVRPEVLGFLRARPDFLHMPQPKGDVENYPTPRGWMLVNRLLGVGLSDVESLRGAVGEGAATELAAFLRMVQVDLPTYEEIVQAPKEVKIPSEKPSHKHATSAMVACRMEMKDVQAIFTYLERWPREWQVKMVKDALRRLKPLEETQVFAAWASANADLWVV